jgi:PAP2 superfamily
MQTELTTGTPRARAVITAIVLTASSALAVPGTAMAANVVVEWNAIAISTALAVGQGPVPQTRSMAIVAVAVNDAVNAVTKQYPTYAATPTPPTGASADAAAIGAAHEALLLLYPGQASSLDDAVIASLSAHGLSVSDPGVGFGAAVAQAVFASRLSDGSTVAQFPYTAPGSGNPGVWVPTPPANLPALLPGWGFLQTWVLRSGSQFRPDAGPSLTSEEYARDFNEVKALGSLTSATRTAEQTNIARFWLTSAAVIWDAALRQVATARDLDTATAAHALALVNLAGADAAIACWDAKYAVNFWRPITAIRNADLDGNPNTAADPAWASLVPTPNFPEFVSGHTTISGAMGTMLALLFGDDPGMSITVTSPTNPGFVRTWSTFSQGIAEVIDARVWTGIHFRGSDVQGARIGRNVGRFVFKHGLRESGGDGSVQ